MDRRNHKYQKYPTSRSTSVVSWLGAGAVIGLLTFAGCAPVLAQSPPGAPPPPAPVPPNASRVVATVIKHTVWPPGSLTAGPPLPADRTFYSLTLQVRASRPEEPGLDALAQPGIGIEAFSAEVLPSDLVGRRIEATVKLSGDTEGVRWWVSNIRVLP